MRPPVTRAMTGGSKDRRRAGDVAGEGDARRRDGDPGSGPAAGHGVAADDLAAAERGRPRPELGHRDGRHPPEGNGGPVASEVGEGHVLQSGQHEAARPKGPRQGMTPAGLHELGRSGDHAGLGPPEELVAGEGHEAGAGLERLAHRWLAVQPRRGPLSAEPRRRGVQQAGAHVGDHREAEGDQLGDFHRGR